MKKILISMLLMGLFSTMVLAAGVEGKWKAKIDTDNGPWEFTVVYEVDGKVISGEFITEYGNLEFGPGKIKGKKFEYSFEIEYVKYTHNGQLINKNEILIKSTDRDGEDVEFTLTRID